MLFFDSICLEKSIPAKQTTKFFCANFQTTNSVITFIRVKIYFAIHLILSFLFFLRPSVCLYVNHATPATGAPCRPVDVKRIGKATSRTQ